MIIDHGLGLFSMLAHLSAIDVHEGDRVAAGQRLGRVGATGRVTGPHLHWAVRASGARVDPLSLLASSASLPPSRRARSDACLDELRAAIIWRAACSSIRRRLPLMRYIAAWMLGVPFSVIAVWYVLGHAACGR